MSTAMRMKIRDLSVDNARGRGGVFGAGVYSGAGVEVRGSWKVTGNCTIRQIIRLTIIQLFDVEYYDDLEIWVRRHSRSLKMVPLESLNAVSASLFYSNYGAIVYRL